MSILSRGLQIEQDFYRLKAQEWACEPHEAEEKIVEAMGIIGAEFVLRRDPLSNDDLLKIVKKGR